MLKIELEFADGVAVIMKVGSSVGGVVGAIDGLKLGVFVTSLVGTTLGIVDGSQLGV